MSLAGSDVTLTDTVAYRNLVPGKTYTISGTLMDQRTGKAVTVNGKSVTSSADFTPDTADGETKVDFHFDTKGLDDTTVVVFERCSMERQRLQPMRISMTRDRLSTSHQ